MLLFKSILGFVVCLALLQHTNAQIIDGRVDEDAAHAAAEIACSDLLDDYGHCMDASSRGGRVDWRGKRHWQQMCVKERRRSKECIQVEKEALMSGQGNPQAAWSGDVDAQGFVDGGEWRAGQSDRAAAKGNPALSDQDPFIVSVHHRKGSAPFSTCTSEDGAQVGCNSEEEEYGSCMEGSLRNGLANRQLCREARLILEACLLKAQSGSAGGVDAGEEERKRESQAEQAEVGTDRGGDTTTLRKETLSPPAQSAPPASRAPTLVVARPLHWQVVGIETFVQVVAYVHNIAWPPPESLRAQSVFGSSRGEWPLLDFCKPMSPSAASPELGAGEGGEGGEGLEGGEGGISCRLEVRIDARHIGTGSHLLAMRLFNASNDAPGQRRSLGPLSELRVRIQHPFEGSWSEMYQWYPPLMCSQADPSSEMQCEFGGVKGEGGEPTDHAAALEKAAGGPGARSGWPETGSADAANGGDGEESTRAEGAREEEQSEQQTVLAVVGVEAGAEGVLEAMLAAPPSLPSSLAASRRCQLVWYVVAEDAHLAVRALHRHAPHFKLFAAASLAGAGSESQDGGRARSTTQGSESESAKETPAHSSPEPGANLGAERVAGAETVDGEDADAVGRWLGERARGRLAMEVLAGGPGGSVTVCVLAPATAEQAPHAPNPTQNSAPFASARTGGEVEGESAAGAERACAGGRWVCGPSAERERLLRLLTPFSAPEQADAAGATRVSWVMPRLYGQLGNVLWQTAAAFSLAADLDRIRLHDRRWSLLLPAPQDPSQSAKTFAGSVLSSSLLPRRNLHAIAEHDWHYLDEGPCHICFHNLTHDAISTRPGASLLVRGWRNSYLYVAHHRPALIEAFSLPAHVESWAESKMRALVGADTDLETVSVHVRRGDLLAHEKTAQEILSVEYYQQAVERMRDGGDKLFLIFSDDINFCRSQPVFRNLPHVRFVEVGVDFVELRLMAMCDHHIIANSTFSYWGAFLHHPPRWRRPQQRRKHRRSPSSESEPLQQPHWQSMPTGGLRRSQHAAPSVGEEWRGVTVVAPEVWGRGEGGGGEVVGVEELYPPQWLRVPNALQLGSSRLT